MSWSTVERQRKEENVENDSESERTPSGVCWFNHFGLFRIQEQRLRGRRLGKGGGTGRGRGEGRWRQRVIRAKRGFSLKR